MLAILHEDTYLLVVSKPGGILSQGTPAGERTLEAEVRRHLGAADPGAVYLGTVHRLDRPVSGVILWAKTPKAARRVADQFARREARKEYWAIVEGTPPDEVGTWEDWLCLDDTGLGRVQVCSRHAPRARYALTRFRSGRAQALPDGSAWLRLWPETGRTHQLRVQAAERGLPILGDRLYGSTRPFAEGIALHARSLTIRHPALDRPMTFEAPPPPTWAEQGVVVGAEPEIIR